MSDVVERRFDDLTVRIDRTLCVGFGGCVELAPDAFDLDDDDVAFFVASGRVDRGRLLKACETCPVDALLVFDRDGRQIVP